MTSAVVAIAEAIRRPVVVLMLWIGEATLFAAQHCQMCPRAGLVLLDIGESCSRVARGILPPRR
jgi:hypothetical protein